jgi:hypothetical protein
MKLLLFKISILALHLKLHARLPKGKSEKILFIFVMLVGNSFCKKVNKVITKLPNSEQSYKGKVKTHKYINRQNQSTTGNL